MRKLKDGVWQEEPGVVHWSAKDQRFLLTEMSRTQKRKSRLCAHQSETGLQEMLICQGPASEIVMHSHLAAESCVLVSGRMVMEFADGRRITMERGDYLRIPAGVEHRPRPLESCLLLEFTVL